MAMGTLNPQQFTAFMPNPAVTLGQVQQGQQLYQQNLRDIVGGLRNIGKARNAAAIDRALQSGEIDFTDSQAVMKRLAPLMRFTTDAARQGVMDRIKMAGADEARKSKVGLQDAQAGAWNVKDDLLRAQAGQADAQTRAQKLKNAITKATTQDEIDRLRAISQRTKADSDVARSTVGSRVKQKAAEAEGAVRRNEATSLRNLGELQRQKIQQEKWNLQKDQYQQSKNQEAAKSQMKQQLLETLRNPRLTAREKADAKRQYEFITGEKTDMFDRKQTPFTEATGERMKAEVTEQGAPRILDRMVDKTEAAFNQAAGNWFDRPLDPKTQEIVRATILELSADPDAMAKFQSGDPQAIFDLVNNELKKKGISLDTEYDPDLFSPRSWVLPQVKAKRR
jgi:hypothetical protein